MHDDPEKARRDWRIPGALWKRIVPDRFARAPTGMRLLRASCVLVWRGICSGLRSKLRDTGCQEIAHRLHVLHVLNDSLRFLRWRSRIGLGLLLRQLTRMDDDKAQALLRNTPVTVLHLHLAQHAVAMPAARHFVLRPPRLLDQEGQRRLLASPRFKLLPDSTGARNQGH
jgi:hypothetical protein